MHHKRGSHLFGLIKIRIKMFHLHHILMNMQWDTSSEQGKLHAKQKHLGCKKGEANQKQQLSDCKSIHSYTCD